MTDELSSGAVSLTANRIADLIGVVRGHMATSRIVIGVDDVTFTPTGGKPMSISRVVSFNLHNKEPRYYVDGNPMGKPLTEWFRGKLK